MNILYAELNDLQEILELQYLAYQSEARLFKNKDIPPLKETLDELTEEFNNGVIFKMTIDGRIIGSVRAYELQGTVCIGKLMVHPDYRRRGYGSMLLKAVEKSFPGMRYELFTSTRSEDNIRLYEKSGYQIFKRRKINDELEFVYLEKR